jgi:hypothetical protein
LEFVSWETLATSAGALAFVLALTQFTKGWPLIAKLPTQVWSWIIALVGMYPAYYFTGQLTPEAAFLIPFNAALVALAANGGFEGIKRLSDALTQKTE